MKDIKIKGAKENNLKNVDLVIPREKFIVFTGLSGSGKSSLAFDTIFAEGQRRYMESLSSYARMFLGQMQKPDVEYIEGLSPSVSIDQKTTSHNPRSTVGTVTEIYDYLRLLYARIGVPHCPNCGKEIKQQTIDQICDKILKRSGKIQILAPIVRGKKGEYKKEFEKLRKAGYLRVRVDGENRMLDEDIELEKTYKHTISVVVDRIVIKDGIRTRLTDALENALKLTNGLVVVDFDGDEALYSTRYSCPDCDINIEELSPRLFSFNSPYGACPNCLGLGIVNKIDPELLIKDENASIYEGAIGYCGLSMSNRKIFKMQANAICKYFGFSPDTPWKNLSEECQNVILYGNNGKKMRVEIFHNGEKKFINMNYDGLASKILKNANEMHNHDTKELAKYFITEPCDVCGGKRLKIEAVSVTIGGKNIHDLCDMPVSKIDDFLENLKLGKTQEFISHRIIKEIRSRLQFLINVGLSYLTLTRSAGTLSGGESQRIRLATQIGSGLTGVLYILDEPSIGLHQKDNEKLIKSLKGLRDLGNTLIVVEHDEDTMRECDYIVDIGPKAGVHGGEVVAQGTIDDIVKAEESITGKYLSGKFKIAIPDKRREPTEKHLTILGAKQNNLKNVNVKIPLGLLNVVTGVSGSGKSSLVNGILYPALANKLNKARLKQGKFDKIDGFEHLDKVIDIDQSPIGRTPRSNPATYTGVFTAIRDLFAQIPDAKTRGYKTGRFSFNVAGGRCENCSGDGIIKIEMHFLPDIFVPCEVCGGKRYNRETLEVKYKGKSIADVLDMTVEEATEFFKNIPRIYNKISMLNEVGLGYIKLGQSSTTLSGGEAQRVKLATELAKRSTGKTLYILDEPTTGLHSHDVAKLADILQRLVANGNTVVVIEHNLDIVKIADNIIDLGPEGGDAGGQVLCTGTPEEIAKCKQSYTGEFLKKIL